MKIRYDAVLVSSTLFTIAFLLLVPVLWHNAQAGIPFWHFAQAAHHDRAALDSMGPGFADYAIMLGEAGLAGLALVLVVLIIVWKGYVRNLQWTWFVMLMIVWGWYFPFFIHQSLSYARGFEKMRFLLYTPWGWNLLVMLAALVLPIRSFFCKRPGTSDAAS